MKKKIFAVFLLTLLTSLFTQGQQTEDNTDTFAGKNVISSAEIAIIPTPVSLIKQPGHFVLPSNITIQAPKSDELNQTIAFLEKKLTGPTGYFAKTVHGANPNVVIRLILNQTPNQITGDEGYELLVNPKLITVRANKSKGLFYGLQTLVQLFPKEIESKEEIKGIKWVIPCVKIIDYPRVKWRGLMFDVARHFFTKQEVMQFIDNMARYKYNVLHWHLTDDEGWRIEIKAFPKLAQVGAWNVKRVGVFGDFIPPKPEEPRNYGGFYTQDEIKEVIAYAQARFVDILPEVDVPGHSLAAIASYPELSCTPEAVNYKVRSGEKIMDWSRGAPPIALVDNTLCPANEKVYAFLDSVFTEIANLFPFPYIHVGGDEASHNFWEKNPQIQNLMKRENLTTMPQVQAYFEKRLEQIIALKGKKIIAWDEVLDGDAPPSIEVMSWRSMQNGITAANQKRRVVMTPREYCYLDYMQADAITEPKVYASLRLSKCYEFDPIPAEVDSNLILGGQGNLWTEQIYNMRQVEYMLWPRGFALAECMWSPKEKKNWPDFFARTEQHFKRLNFSETKYAPSVYDPVFKVRRTPDKDLLVTLTTEIEGLSIHYSFDNSFPDCFYPKYEWPLTVPIDAKLLRVITYRDKEPVGRMMTMPVDELQKRAGK